MARLLRPWMLLAPLFWASPLHAQAADCATGITVPAISARTPADIAAFRKSHRGARLIVKDAALEGADFSRLNISNVCFVNSKLARTRWSAAKGDRLAFKESDLRDSTWMGFRGAGVSFEHASLDRAKLSRVRMPHVVFLRSSVQEVDASHADLSHGQFSGIWSSYLTKAKFDHANLTGFAFRCGLSSDDACGQYSSDVSFRSTNLTDAILSMPSLSGLDFAGAHIRGTRIHWTQIRWFRPSRLAGSLIIEPLPWSPMVPPGAQVDPQARDRLEKLPLSPGEVRQIWAAQDEGKEPGFDCGRARSATEKYICANRYADFEYYYPAQGAAIFADQDNELNEAFAAAKRRHPDIVGEQRRWLRSRDRCLEHQGTVERDHCIADAYRSRIDELWARSDAHPVLGKGEKMLFVDADFPSLTNIASASLRRKLSRMIAQNGWQVMLVERDRAGRLHVRAESVGPNYHLGSLWSPPEGLILNRGSGCFGALSYNPETRQSEFHPVVRFRGRYADPGTECPNALSFNDFIMTGARANFGRMERLLLSTPEIDRLFRAAGNSFPPMRSAEGA